MERLVKPAGDLKEPAQEGRARAIRARLVALWMVCKDRATKKAAEDSAELTPNDWEQQLPQATVDNMMQKFEAAYGYMPR